MPNMSDQRHHRAMKSFWERLQDAFMVLLVRLSLRLQRWFPQAARRNDTEIELLPPLPREVRRQLDDITRNAAARAGDAENRRRS